MKSIKKSFFINVYIILSVIFIFTNYIYGHQGQIMIGLATYLICITFVFKKDFKINGRDFMFVLLGFMFLISSFKSSTYSQAINYSIAFILITINMIIISKEKDFNYKKLFNTIFICSSVHVFATIIYQLFPQIIQGILPYILKGNDLTRNIYEFNYNHIVCGISPIQGLNAIYISSYIMVVFSKLLNNNKKIYNIILLIFGFIALFLTSKRGLLVSNLFAIIALIAYDQTKKGKIQVSSLTKLIFLSLITFLVGGYIIRSYFPEALKIFSRFQQQNLLTGRDVFWRIVWEDFTSNGIPFGSGLFSSRKLIFLYTGTVNDIHNIYLQVLAETGIFGFGVFVINIMYILKRLKKIKLTENNKELVIPAVYLVIVYLIYGLTGNWLFDITTLFLFYVIIGLLFNERLCEDEKGIENRNINIS